ncbi:hypothetical protein AB6A40_006907 [Gnathostoma spinigerum]|uniref:ABC transmembrane type-1 domain-containing protein n=1 Tax=Gnathostoma spinigerum TaxID=75299 RepID=A0ABD6EJQ2_9BILA
MGKHRALEQDFYFDRHFFFRLGTIARLLFPTFDWAIVIIGLILLFQAANEYAGFNIGILPGKMYTDLMSRDAPSFWTHFWQGSLVLVGKCFLSSAVSFFASMLYLFWRKNIVKKMQERYFSHRIYYKMNCIDDHGIDNPDQRITQDVERMLNVLATNVIPSVLIGPFMVAFYSYKTASTAGGLGIAIIYAYFVLGTIVNRIVISPMTKWNARVEKAEGDFRYKHVTVRDNAESSALFNAQNFERLECERLFSVLWWRQIKFLSWRVLPLCTFIRLLSNFIL